MKALASRLFGEELVNKTLAHAEYMYASSICAIKLQKELRPHFKIAMAVLAHERPEYLQACLDSLFRTNLYDYDITFLIQDDGSVDPKVKDIIEKERDSQYKIVRTYTPKGHDSWGAAFNKAVKQLLALDDFDIIGTCDSDAFFHPDWLDQTMKVCLWAKKHHKQNILGPFSSFNSSDASFHRILGRYPSPYGGYLVKERMGALNYFFFREDFLKLGFFHEHRDDETIKAKQFKKYAVRSFCTETSYIEHLGRTSVLDQWRPQAVGENAAYALLPARTGWIFPEQKSPVIPVIRLSQNLVLQVRYGGLGDHLFFSHLPRIAKQTGAYRNVYISNRSEFRDPEIRRLVWERNPYVDGFCDEWGDQALFDALGPGCNLLDTIMLCLGMDDGLRYHEPELYYQPSLKEELKNTIIFDPNYISNAGRITSDKIDRYFYDNDIRIDYQMITRSKFLSISSCINWLESRSLEDFCDILYSCKHVYCLVTGTATLAAALNKGATVFYDKRITPIFLHSKINTYVNLK